MPANKNALIRYKTIDNCLRNRYRRWTLEDLVDACSDALYDCEGITKGVSIRTVQADIQMMRSDKLGYNAPIEVYDHKYYRYADEDFSITNMPLSQNDYEVLSEAVDMLRQLGDFEQFAEVSDIVGRLQDKLSTAKYNRTPIVHFDSVPLLKGLKLLNPLYNYIAQRRTIKITYESFKMRHPMVITFYPYLLKEFRNRWFVFGSTAEYMKVYNLALDRIISIEEADDIPYKTNPDFDTEHYFDDIIGVSKDINDTPVEVTFKASREQSKYIITKPLHNSQKLVERQDDGSCIFSIKVILNFEFYSVIMSYGDGVALLSPPKAVRHISTTLLHALKEYE